MRKFILALILLPLTSYAGKSRLNCKPDRVLDAPMQLSAQILNPYKVQLTASGGSDRSGRVYVSSYSIYDSSGNQVSYFPDAIYIGDESALNNVVVQGLTPGQSYNVVLTTNDGCLNSGTTKISLSMPADQIAEANPPLITRDLTVDSFWILLGYAPMVRVFANDDTLIRHVTFKVDEQVIYDFDTKIKWVVLANGTDEGSTAYEGENYAFWPTNQQRGGSHSVTVILTDVYGNVVTQTKDLYIW